MDREQPRRRRYTKEQREWVKEYKDETTFEPLMDDYLAGNKSFYDCARHSVRWFQDWSSDAFLNVSRCIPGDEEAMIAQEQKE